MTKHLKYPDVLRRDILDAQKRGMSYTELTALTGVPRGTISSWKTDADNAQRLSTTVVTADTIQRVDVVSQKNKERLSKAQGLILRKAISEIYKADPTVSTAVTMDSLKRRTDLSFFSERISVFTVSNKLCLLRKGISIIKHNLVQHEVKYDKTHAEDTDMASPLNTVTTTPVDVSMTITEAGKAVVYLVQEYNALKGQVVKMSKEILILSGRNEVLAKQLMEKGEKELERVRFSIDRDIHNKD